MSGEVGFTWWRARMLTFLSIYSYEAGRLDQAEASGRAAAPVCLRIGDRLNALYSLANLARCATRRGDHERAGVLWGAIEAEEERGRVGAWEDERPKYSDMILAATGPDFERGCRHGRELTLESAVDDAVAAPGHPSGSRTSIAS